MNVIAATIMLPKTHETPDTYANSYNYGIECTSMQAGQTPLGMPAIFKAEARASS